jgi:hypothetical protein
MKAIITSAKFSELYTRFQNSYGNAEGPVIVMYYRENNAVHCYMNFSNTCWKTTLDIENASKFLTLFSQPVELTKNYD